MILKTKITITAKAIAAHAVPTPIRRPMLMRPASSIESQTYWTKKDKDNNFGEGADQRCAISDVI